MMHVSLAMQEATHEGTSAVKLVVVFMSCPPFLN